MAYCSPGDPFTLLDSPEFFSTVLHIMGTLSIPIYLFGGYCILKQTPGDMHTVKFSLLNFHFWSCFVDLVLSLLTTPYMLGPLFAGIPMGILSFIGMSTAPQVYLVMATEAAMGIAILGLFENRYFILSSSTSWWAKLRIPWYIVNYFVAFAYYYPAYAGIAEDQTDAKEYVYTWLPCLPETVMNGSIFLVGAQSTIIALSGPAEIVFIFLQGAVILQLITRALTQYGNQISSKTIKLQRKFIRSLKLQVALPFVIFVLPIVYSTAAGYAYYHNQALNNFAYMVLSTHGLFSTLSLVLIHKPYKRFVLEKIGCARKEEERKSMSSVVSATVTTMF